jgi:uncharacterized protein (DUF2384 family)
MEMSSREVAPALSKDVVLQHARDTFGEPKKVYSWMNTPNSMFSGMRPKDLLEYATPEDLCALIDELDRIDQGIF